MKSLKFFVLLVVIAFAFSAVTPALASGLAQDETPPVIVLADFPVLEALLIGAISWVVTEGLKSLSKLTKKPLEGYSTAVTGAVVYLALFLVNAFLGAIPPEMQEAARGVLAFLVGVLGMYGIAGRFKASASKGAKV